MPSYNSLLNNPTKSRFIGSFIHEYSLDSRGKQRPSKRARQRMRKRLEKLKLEEGNTKISPDSGYDTTSGDCQTPGLSAVKEEALVSNCAKESCPIQSSPNSSKKTKKTNTSGLSEGNVSKSEDTSKTVHPMQILKCLHTFLHAFFYSILILFTQNLSDLLII